MRGKCSSGIEYRHNSKHGDKFDLEVRLPRGGSCRRDVLGGVHFHGLFEQVVVEQPRVFYSGASLCDLVPVCRDGRAHTCHSALPTLCHVSSISFTPYLHLLHNQVLVCVVLGDMGEITRAKGEPSFLNDFPKVKYDVRFLALYVGFLLPVTAFITPLPSTNATIRSRTVYK